MSREAEGVFAEIPEGNPFDRENGWNTLAKNVPAASIRKIGVNCPVLPPYRCDMGQFAGLCLMGIGTVRLCVGKAIFEGICG